MTDFFPIETPYSSKDYEIMKSVVNVGIDSSLKAFTKSEFKKSPHFANKFLWNIHILELPILYRRLKELYKKTGDDDYQDFLDEIKNAANSPEEEMGENSSDSLTNQHGKNLKPSTIDETTDTERYEDVIFFQGDEAEETMSILTNHGRDAAMAHLMQLHDPGNHMGRNELPHGTDDKTYEKDGYIMGWNPHLPYIGLTYDTQYKNVDNENPMALKEDDSKRITSLKDFAAKFNITPTGQNGKFSVKDFNDASANFDKDDAFDFAMILANIYLKRKIGLGWDDMGDVNSLWDYIDKGMTAADLFAAAQDAAKERLEKEGMGDLDEDFMMKRHLAGQRGKIGNTPLGQHAPHSQSAIEEDMETPTQTPTETAFELPQNKSRINGKYKTKNAIKNAIYKVLSDEKIEGRYTDENWDGIKKLQMALNNHDIQYDFIRAEYTGHGESSGSSLPTKKIYEYKLYVRDNEGKNIEFYLRVTCAFVGKTGTMADSQYELTYYFS